MAYVIDEGSVFDAPIDRIWKYLSSQDHRHPSATSPSREQKDNVVTLSNERELNGKKMRFKVRLTLFPPVGYVQEFLEGPLAGSKAFQYYLPKGDKTGVTVIGEYKMQGAEDAAVREAVMKMLETSFNEDNENLKSMK